MKAATGKDIAEHVIRLTKVLTTGLALASYISLIINILRLWWDLMKMEEWCIMQQVKTRLLVLI
jgi:hypothetical protein